MFFNRGGSKKKAFTLAEVLITLSIIGVIAVMTIPVLVNDYNRRIWATILRRNYSVVTNMCERMLVDENAERITELDVYPAFALAPANIPIAVQGFVQRYINNASRFETAAAGAGDPFSGVVGQGCSWRMDDGSNIHMFAGNGLFYFGVDVNGQKAPNTMGVDRFAFNLGDTCAYTRNGHVNNTSYGTFKFMKEDSRNGWTIPNEPREWAD